MSAYNAVSGRQTGLTVGLFNHAEDLCGIQLGLLNHVPSNPAWARWLPLINYENRQCGLRATKAVMAEGGVIRSEAVRHPLEPLHPATRAGLLELAREADPLALRWGK